MNIQELVQREINNLVRLLEETQAYDGTWRFCFESGPMTEANMIILFRLLNIADEQLVKKLVDRITSLQQENGAWKLFADEKDGNLSATIIAYYALLFSGYFSKNHSRMLAAKRFIQVKGGIAEADSLTKVFLSITGQYPWKEHVQLPIELLLLPPTLPLSFFDFVGYARVHIVPILVLADQQFILQKKKSPDLSNLYVSETYHSIRDDAPARDNYRTILDKINLFIEQLAELPAQLRAKALDYAKQYMLSRIEADGTLYSYASCTFLMIYALLALGYSVSDPVIHKAIAGLKALVCPTNTGLLLQNSTSTVWDTALISYTLQEAGVSDRATMIQKANNYLLTRQQERYADWSLRNPGVIPGGWGFSDINTINPDVDDTTAALRSLSQAALDNGNIFSAWHRGLNWVLSMQNRDGGWSAFEKNTDKAILLSLPFDGINTMFIDPSTADLTGRTIEFLGNYTTLNKENINLRHGIEWLLNHQEEDGSWYGRWGICYIYGTWAALTGLAATGVVEDHPSIGRAVHWLESIQHADGGWGESCYSDILHKYTPLKAGTPSQTAWAVDALIAVSSRPTEAIIKGINYLLEARELPEWILSYPTGAGLPGGFYIHYHSYRYIWPLRTLAHFLEKFGD